MFFFFVQMCTVVVSIKTKLTNLTSQECAGKHHSIPLQFPSESVHTLLRLLGPQEEAR